MSGPRKKKPAEEGDAPSLAIFGFGFEPHESEHHFVVAIPHGTSGDVVVGEQFVWHAHPERRSLSLALGNAESKARVMLGIDKWNAIAEPLAQEFNARLKNQ